jgi:hypothetical protein
MGACGKLSCLCSSSPTRSPCSVCQLSRSCFRSGSANWNWICCAERLRVVSRTRHWCRSSHQARRPPCCRHGLRCPLLNHRVKYNDQPGDACCNSLIHNAVVH